MKKLTASIILSCFFSLVYSQSQTKVLINLKLIESESERVIKSPKVQIKTFQGLDTLVKGDSLGNILLNISFKRNSQFLLFDISAQNHYSSKIALPIDTNQDSIKIDTVFEISPQLICVDTWILPDIYFDFNKSEMNQFTKKENSTDSINLEALMPLWVSSFVNNPVLKNTKLEIISFSDYSENDKISQKRLKFVNQKLISLGFPKDKIVLTNKNKQDRIQVKYRDGCYPYYYFDNQNLTIDKNLIKSESNKTVANELRKLRQVVTFNWVLEKN